MARKKKSSKKKNNRFTHVQGRYWSDVYRDGKAHVYTAWNDNDPDVGTAMSYEEWAKPYKKKRRR